MNSKSEALFSEQLAAINNRLEAIESRLDGEFASVKIRPTTPGSFPARMQAARNALNKKLRNE